jgi:uncharacterized protein
MLLMEIKYMTFAAEVKAVSEAGGIGKITGYGSVFGVIDSYGDIVERGAFMKSLSEKGAPVMLWQHNQDEPIGVWKIATEDSNGLLLEGEINLKVQRGLEAYELAKQGAFKGLSIGYRAAGETTDTNGVRHLKEVELYEVSLVTFPANRSALISAVKAEEMTERQFEDFLREAGFSRSRAKAIVATGFRSSQALRDAGTAEVVEGLNKTLTILRS